MKHWKQLVAATLLGCCAQAWATPTLSLDTGTGTATLGSNVTYAVNISDVSNLGSYNFSLTYDASLLSFIGISEGNFFGSGSYFGYVEDLSTPGMVNYVWGMYGDSGLASGSGALAHLEFKTLALGTNVFGFEDVLFIEDWDAPNMSPALLPGQVRIVPVAIDPVDPSDVPEPASYMLFGVGLVGAAALRRRAVAARR